MNTAIDLLPKTMKIIAVTAYGSEDVLQIEHIPTPIPNKNEICLQIVASTVSSGDARIRGLNVPFGFKWITKLFFGISAPRKKMLGSEFAGRVVSVGTDVTEFRVGDTVFGATDSLGTHAEYICVNESGAVVKIPSGLSFEEAASLPFGCLTSLTYLIDFAKIKEGDRILINGASGSLGVAGVQIAKYKGAIVTALCSQKNHDLVKRLGADKVIDYREVIPEDIEGKFDIIYDTVGNLSYFKMKHLLSSKGRFLLAVAGLKQYLTILYVCLTRQKKMVAGLALFNKNYMNQVKSLYEEGALVAVIDSIHSFENIKEAHRRVDLGHKVGSVVIQNTDSSRE